MTDDEAIAAFAALGSELRYNLWKILLPYGMEGVSAGILAERLTTHPANLSFHLRALVEAKILHRRRVQRNIIYAVNKPIIEQMAAQLAASVPEALSPELASVAAE
jgi:ArsR family transcriptional regulator, arsenate/arsenite/antimonite-responsive transcriptional repressor